MLLPPSDALRFIENYKSVLLEALSAAGKKRSKDIVRDLAEARTHCSDDAAAIDKAIVAVRARGVDLEEDFIKAIQTLRVERWFHLRHTTKYALLLDANVEHAFAVKALTNPLHEIAGGKAVTFEAGIVEYRGQYVCDGIILQPIYLGPNMRAQLNEAYTRIKKAGRFHVRAAA